MSNVEPKSSMPFPHVARSCAKRVAFALPVVLALLALLGKMIEERFVIQRVLASLWDSVLWLVSAGGYFWGAVTVGAIAMCSLAWSVCVLCNLPEKAPAKTHRALVVTALSACAIFLLAAIALHKVYDDFDSLTVYQGIAVYAMRTPFIAVGLAMICAIASAFVNISDEAS